MKCRVVLIALICNQFSYSADRSPLAHGRIPAHVCTGNYLFATLMDIKIWAAAGSNFEQDKKTKIDEFVRQAKNVQSMGNEHLLHDRCSICSRGLIPILFSIEGLNPRDVLAITTAIVEGNDTQIKKPIRIVIQWAQQQSTNNTLQDQEAAIKTLELLKQHSLPSFQTLLDKALSDLIPTGGSSPHPHAPSST